MHFNSSHFNQTFLLFFVFIFVSCTKNDQKAKPSSESSSFKYSAMKDFYSIEKEGYVPFYIDSIRGVVGIDAAAFKDEFAVAEASFKGESGIYHITFTSMTEIDGESSYRILIGDKLVGEFQNPETENDFELIPHTIESVKLENGEKIQVEFNSHSNGKIPEDGAFAYARGRWQGIELVKID